ncbi:hypothetical protein PR202_gb01378 [Eleusine coracana subsp. coracana]|uniref:Protein kinase domain-containing protein n=1 Tax=Eleusine coracana subsp. coracana TaxID=191504 RepID=A0AAV5DVQ8_ELECO|nr:hypothetical protein QOZ80_5BG0419000 [Eleusine coracana subsp. coracana]GJN14537.1 hypothetical protein PR202_gb01378 [Eleusine coracana subsp. coracana]
MDDVRTTMASISALLSALCEKIRGLAAPGTDMELRRVSMACILIAMHNLRSTRRTMKTRKSMTPISALQFVDDEGRRRRLGGGLRACVTKVRHRTTGKTFAMKTLYPLPHQGLDDAAIYNLRVLREASFMAACRGHPSFVCLHGVCMKPNTDQQYCLLMEQAGPSLYEATLYRRLHGTAFREHQVRRMMRQVLSWAKAMHDLGIVHRNIVAENVLVGFSSFTVKIGGFGQATCTSETDVPCNVAVRDEAPELLLRGRGASESELLDSWSIGCLMGKLLTNRTLFEIEANDRDNTARAQLCRIFNVLGVPGKRAMQEMKARNFELAKQVREWRARRSSVGKTNNYRLRQLVPPEVLSDDGFKVLRGLLMCNPKKRLTAGAALQLPWFADNDKSPAAGISQQVSGPVS